MATEEERDKNPDHMEVYHFIGAWKPVPVKSEDLLDIWRTWHDKEAIQEMRQSAARTGGVASRHIEELFNHIAYLEMELEKAHRRHARS